MKNPNVDSNHRVHGRRVWSLLRADDLTHDEREAQLQAEAEAEAYEAEQLALSELD